MNTYFDNASTSFPKPREVAERISNYLNQEGGTYGRASYERIVRATTQVEACRDALAELLNVNRPETVIFTSGATSAVNALLKGFDLPPGSVIWVSPMEHNAVMRVLQYLKETLEIEVHVLPSLSDGTVNLRKLRKMEMKGNEIVIINHQSNVNGVIQPVKEIAGICNQEYIPTVIDVSQSLGFVPVRVDGWRVNAVFFSGHKGLLGPTGTGGFCCRFPEGLDPYDQGGTGSNSDSYDMPEALPDRYEAGTPNIVGIVGLLAAIEEKPAPAHTKDDLLQLMDGLSRIHGIRLYRALDSERQGEVFSFVSEEMNPSVLAGLLYERHRIEVRSGLHCAPLAHRTLGTFPEGTVRVSPSPYHTPADFEYLIKAVADVSR